MGKRYGGKGASLLRVAGGIEVSFALSAGFIQLRRVRDLPPSVSGLQTDRRGRFVSSFMFDVIFKITTNW